MKNFILQFVLFITLISILLGTISVVSAANENIPKLDDLIYTFETVDESGKAEEDSSTATDYIADLPQGDPGTVIGKMVFFVLYLVNFLAFISFAVAGIMMVSSQGNDEKLTKAKNIFNFSILAMVFAATALALVYGLTRLQYFNP